VRLATIESERILPNAFRSLKGTNLWPTTQRADDAKWYDEIIDTARFFSWEIIATLPATTSLLLRLGLLYLLFWYFFDFACDLGYYYLRFAILILIAASLTFTLLIWKLMNSCKNTKSREDREPARILPFVSLNLIPIAAVAVASWYGHSFGWGYCNLHRTL
jgi:hypothetical protein